MFAVRVLPSSIVPGNKKPLQAITEINKMKSILAVLLLTTSLEASAYCPYDENYANCTNQWQQQQQNNWNQQQQQQNNAYQQYRQDNYNQTQQILQQQQLRELQRIENQLRYR